MSSFIQQTKQRNMASNRSIPQVRLQEHTIPPDTVPSVVFGIPILTINGCIFSGVKFSRRSHWDPAPRCLQSNLLLTHLCDFLHFFHPYINLHRAAHHGDDLWALRYNDIVQHGRVFVGLCVTWFISLTSLVRLHWTLNVNIITAKQDLARVQEKETIFSSCNFIVFFFIPLMVMVFLDVRMLLLLRWQCKRIARENLPAEFLKREKKTRAVFICVILLILFIIFWLPFFILELVQHYFGDQFGAPKEVIITVYYLRLFTSLFNPIMYTLRKPALKKAARGIYRKVFPCHEGVIRGKEGTSNHALDDFQPQCKTIPLRVVHEGS
ncbi:Beta-2 adrenergic receptor [Acropora cervicornis]|uniref:Beta-2 adrenergic receptor n=1 Tax=Acropora cervicornis TaxID=6130 RepID=A0AAD9Q6B6_ACRCE|nr:Beta-2 adrenergic receptor [Acropora cervicornis]